MKIDKFVLAITGAVAIAWFFPQWGSESSGIPLNTIGNIGISLIFFFYGLKLSPQKIRSGLKNWKLHILVQGTSFFIFPLIVIAFYPFFTNGEANTIWIAFLFLAALPSTVSSSVVMVSLARGNVPAAIFNASISGLIGIVITPLWMGLFLKNAAVDFDLGVIYLRLLTGILLPVVVGLLLQRYLHQYAVRYGRYLTLFDKSVILLIVYKSFAESFEQKIFHAVNWWELLIMLAAIQVLFRVVYTITGWLSHWLGFNREDRITAQFCGTKKSLVHGTVFSEVLFPASMPVGIILLPLMLFHAWQLFVISVIASRLSKQAPGAD